MTETETCGATWAKHFKVEDKLEKKIDFSDKRISFFDRKFREREGETERRPSFSLRSSEFRRSEFVEPRVKVYLLDEGYTYIPKKKKRDFIENQKEEILRNQEFRARKASYPGYYALRGRDSSYFGLFSTLRVVWLCFLS